MGGVTMSDLEWWCRGEAGEKVLDNIDHFLLGSNDEMGFAQWAVDFGIPSSGILKIIAIHKNIDPSELTHLIN
tara:strand:- start:8559 stop:8777 length:219 start_codon:yes stop_codon:yes gene_type:complete